MKPTQGSEELTSVLETKKPKWLGLAENLKNLLISFPKDKRMETFIRNLYLHSQKYASGGSISLGEFTNYPGLSGLTHLVKKALHWILLLLKKAFIGPKR